MLGYSPYHLDVSKKLKPDVLLAMCEDDVDCRQHAYKFAAKLRSEVKDNAVMLRDLRSVGENERHAFILSFLIKSLYQGGRKAGK